RQPISKKRRTFMAHAYYGDPDEEFSIDLLKTFENSGVDIIEMGCPFSDPTSDGHTFIKVCTRAIKNGMTPNKFINGIKGLRKQGIKIPIVVTSYFNIIYQYGAEKFVKDIKKAGANGLIVPELPIEESDELDRLCKENTIDLIYIIGPYSSEKRIDKIRERASGFLYLVSVSGVTGARSELKLNNADLIKTIKKQTELPVYVGFGISKPEHVKELSKNGADGIIIGSAIAKIYGKYIQGKKIVQKEKCLNEITTFIKEIKKVCSR
ncbi:MAG: tryptophan synthase subunit alpha, partial [Nanoarchaeota archaeon]|nr:tryptophan synthase subunit alpha [Nanoarchaeota archaeon]